MRILQKLFLCEPEQTFLDFERSLSPGDAGTIGDAEDMCIHGNRRFAERRIENDIRRFSANPRKSLEGLTGTRHFAIVFVEQDATGLDYVFGLTVEETDGAYVLLQALDAMVVDCLWCVGNRVELTRGLVDPDIGGLGRQNHGDEQFEWRVVFELSRRLGIGVAQGREDGSSFLAIHGWPCDGDERRVRERAGV